MAIVSFSRAFRLTLPTKTLVQNFRNSSSSSKSRSNSFLASVVCGSLGFSVGLLTAKYPTLKANLGFSKQPDKFVEDPSRERSSNAETNRRLKICEAVMKIAQVAVLSTMSDGEPKSRPVHPYDVDPGIPHIFITTNKRSRKMKQIQADPSVTLTYPDAEGAGYVLVEGVAEVLDREASAALWRPEMFLFYPEGPPSASNPESRFVILKIRPRRIEFTSARFGLETSTDDWQPPSLLWDASSSSWMMVEEAAMPM